jgi:hypothetical protein
MTIEIGPVAHGTAKVDIYEKAKVLVLHSLDYIEMHNQYINGKGEKKDQSYSVLSAKLPVAERVAQINYPLDHQGQICAFVHPHVQGIPELRDGSTVRHGSPIFQCLDGKPVLLDLDAHVSLNGEKLDKNEDFYPVFVNEAAYREHNIAFYLTRIVDHGAKFVHDSKSE